LFRIFSIYAKKTPGYDGGTVLGSILIA